MNKELLTKNDILKELAIESNALENLIDNGKIPYYEFKGDMGFNISEITQSCSFNSVSNNPPLASKHDVYSIVSSFPKKVAILFSNSLCID